MNTFVLEIWDDEGSICTFYTVRWDGDKSSETDKFFSKYENDVNFVRPIQELAMFIAQKIGDEHGALEGFFRFENTAHGLPPKGKHTIGNISINYNNFPLRLYCLRISKNLVVLFNGGEKTSRSAQQGKTSMAFIEANQFATRILKALQENDISIAPNGRMFEPFNNGKEILL
jgi:hypothetical protein